MRTSVRKDEVTIRAPMSCLACGHRWEPATPRWALVLMAVFLVVVGGVMAVGIVLALQSPKTAASSSKRGAVWFYAGFEVFIVSALVVVIRRIARPPPPAGPPPPPQIDTGERERSGAGRTRSPRSASESSANGDRKV
ncbi:MAG: hypothetical protein U0414_10900 [Polyangiaceae bacterium]